MSNIAAEAQNGTGAQANTQGGNAEGQNSAPDVEKISSLSDYRALAARVRVTKEEDESPKSSAGAATGTEAGGVEAPAGESTGAGEGEGQKAGEQGTQGAGEGGEGAGGEQGEEGAGDGAGSEAEGANREEGRGAKRIHLNLQGLSAISRETILIMRRNPDLTPTEAEARAKTKLGVSQQGTATAATATGESQQQKQEGAVTQTLEDTQRKITEARKELREATKQMQFEKQAELQDTLFDLQQQEFQLRRDADTKASHAQVEFTKTVTESQGKALDLYPDVAKADSALVKRMEEIDADLQESGNPLFDSPEKYLKIAQMAANDLGIAPKSKKAASTVAPAKPQGQGQQPARPAAGTTSRTTTQPPPISGGGARTTQSTAAQTLNEVLDKVETPEDYEALKSELKRSRLR